MTRASDKPARYIPWEMLRDAYLERLGPLFEVDERYDFEDQSPPKDGLRNVVLKGFEPLAACETVYLILDLAAFEESSCTVHATFGAATRTGGHEVFLAAAAPWDELRGLLHEKALTGVRLSPGMVIDVPAHGTPFVALLLAPLNAGSVALACPGGAEHCLLRAIPLTQAEARLARTSLDRLVESLRQAGALDTVDLHRDCVVHPEHTRRFWAERWPARVKDERRRVKRFTKNRDELIRLNAPGSFVEIASRSLLRVQVRLRHLESRRREMTARRRRFLAQVKKHRELLLRINEKGLTGLPIPPEDDWRRALDETLGAVLFSHPVAQRHIALLGGLTDFSTADYCATEPRFLIKWLLWWMSQHRKKLDRQRLTMLGEAAAAAAQEDYMTDDGMVPPHEVWTTVVCAMYFELLRAPGTEEPANDLARAILSGIGIGGDGLMLPFDGSPEQRLGDVVRMIALGVLAVRYRVRFGEPHGGSEGPIYH